MNFGREKLICSEHQQNEIIYIQVNNIKEKQKIFYCEICISRDYNFKPQNFVRIKQVQDYSQDQVIAHWPPLSNTLLQKNIIQIADSNEMIRQTELINEYFDDLKLRVISKIDFCQKQIIQQCLSMYSVEDNVFQQYEQISKIGEFQKILEDKNGTIKQKEEHCREFIKMFQGEKAENTKRFELLFKNYKENFDSQQPNLMKHQILSAIDRIKFFDSQSEQAAAELVKGDLMRTIDFVSSESKIIHSGNNQVMSKEVNYSFQFESNQQRSYGSYYTNIILEKEPKYQFVFQVSDIKNKQDDNYLQFGLIRDEKVNESYYNEDKLCCSLCYQKDTFFINNFVQGITKVVSGNFQKLPQNTLFQLTICIAEELLQLKTLTPKEHIVELEDMYKKNLKEYENLRFYICVQNFIKVSLHSAKIV